MIKNKDDLRKHILEKKRAEALCNNISTLIDFCNNNNPEVLSFILEKHLSENFVKAFSNAAISLADNYTPDARMMSSIEWFKNIASENKNHIEVTETKEALKQDTSELGQIEKCCSEVMTSNKDIIYTSLYERMNQTHPTILQLFIKSVHMAFYHSQCSNLARSLANKQHYFAYI